MTDMLKRLQFPVLSDMTDMSSESDLKARKEVETVMSGQLCFQAGKSLTLVVRLYD